MLNAIRRLTSRPAPTDGDNQTKTSGDDDEPTQTNDQSSTTRLVDYGSDDDDDNNTGKMNGNNVDGNSVANEASLDLISNDDDVDGDGDDDDDGDGDDNNGDATDDDGDDDDGDDDDGDDDGGDDDDGDDDDGDGDDNTTVVAGDIGDAGDTGDAGDAVDTGDAGNAADTEDIGGTVDAGDIDVIKDIGQIKKKTSGKPASSSNSWDALGSAIDMETGADVDPNDVSTEQKTTTVRFDDDNDRTIDVDAINDAISNYIDHKISNILTDVDDIKRVMYLFSKQPGKPVSNFNPKDDFHISNTDGNYVIDAGHSNGIHRFNFGLLSTSFLRGVSDNRKSMYPDLMNVSKNTFEYKKCLGTLLMLDFISMFEKNWEENYRVNIYMTSKLFKNALKMVTNNEISQCNHLIPDIDNSSDKNCKQNALRFLCQLLAGDSGIGADFHFNGANLKDIEKNNGLHGSNVYMLYIYGIIEHYTLIRKCRNVITKVVDSSNRRLISKSKTTNTTDENVARRGKQTPKSFVIDMCKMLRDLMVDHPEASINLLLIMIRMNYTDDDVAFKMIIKAIDKTDKNVLERLLTCDIVKSFMIIPMSAREHAYVEVLSTIQGTKNAYIHTSHQNDNVNCKVYDPYDSNVKFTECNISMEECTFYRVTRANTKSYVAVYNYNDIGDDMVKKYISLSTAFAQVPVTVIAKLVIEASEHDSNFTNEPKLNLGFIMDVGNVKVGADVENIYQHREFTNMHKYYMNSAKQYDIIYDLHDKLKHLGVDFHVAYVHVTWDRIYGIKCTIPDYELFKLKNKDQSLKQYNAQLLKIVAQWMQSGNHMSVYVAKAQGKRGTSNLMSTPQLPNNSTIIHGRTAYRKDIFDERGIENVEYTKINVDDAFNRLLTEIIALSDKSSPDVVDDVFTRHNLQLTGERMCFKITTTKPTPRASRASRASNVPGAPEASGTPDESGAPGNSMNARSARGARGVRGARGARGARSVRGTGGTGNVRGTGAPDV